MVLDSQPCRLLQCLDHLFVFSELTLRRAISSYVAYYNHHRPHRSIGQRAPCASGRAADRPPGMRRSVIAEPVTTFIGTLHNRPHFCAPQPLVSARPGARTCSTKQVRGATSFAWRTPAFGNSNETALTHSRRRGDRDNVRRRVGKPVPSSCPLTTIHRQWKIPLRSKPQLCQSDTPP